MIQHVPAEKQHFDNEHALNGEQVPLKGKELLFLSQMPCFYPSLPYAILKVSKIGDIYQ